MISVQKSSNKIKLSCRHLRLADDSNNAAHPVICVSWHFTYITASFHQEGRFGSIGLVLSPVFTRFVITSSYLYKVSCLIYIICVCLRTVVSSITHCVVLLLGLSSSCVLCVASFSGLSIFDSPFGILKRLLTS